MKIILLKDIAKLGQRFDIKEVSDGHALNMLIPRGLAITATADAMKKYSQERAKREGEKKMEDELMAKSISDLGGKVISVEGKANEKGHLFAGLHKKEIADEIAKQTRISLDQSFIMLDQPIKTVGDHDINIEAGGKKAKLILKVAAKETPKA